MTGRRYENVFSGWRTDQAMKSAAKKLVRLALPALSAVVLFAGVCSAGAEERAPQQKCALVIHATGFHTQKGKAGAAVFNSRQGWPNDTEKSYVGSEIPKSNGTATFDYQVPPGVYAIVVIDDLNENEKLDRNFLGIPKEGFGFANNPRVFFRAPSFETASIEVKCPRTETTIHMDYR